MTANKVHLWLIVAIVGGLALAACVEPLVVARGTRMPSEHREISSAEVTEAFTKHVRGDRLSVAATLIDFSYVRAVTRERQRSREAERETYQRYVRSKTAFYVHLVLHGVEACREPRAEGRDERSPLRFRDWTFSLETSAGRQRELLDVEAGPTQLAPSGGCLVQGYVHFQGNVGRADEWVQLSVAFEDQRRFQARLRWDVTLFQPPRRTASQPRASQPRPAPRESAEEDDGFDDEE